MSPARCAAIAVLLALAPRASAAQQLTRSRVVLPGGAIELAVEPGERPSFAQIEQWVRRAGVAVSSFYGRFPVRSAVVIVSRVPGRGIGGTAYSGRTVRMRLGVDTPPGRLRTDWAMTHELFHLGFPDLDRRHLWMQEGLATYFEPIARARVGDMTAAQVWHELFRDLPQGFPRAGDGGLDQTSTWGATYWGGALFWFLADIEIRQRTRNRRSADDALRAILAAGGDGSRLWSVERVLRIGDRATGTAALATTYDRLARRRFRVDLDALAARLGVDAGRFDDGAPLAAIRRSITAPIPKPARQPARDR